MVKIAAKIPLSQQGAPSSSLLRSFFFLKKYRYIAAGVYVLALASNGLAVFIPQTIRWIVDAGIIQQNLNILAGFASWAACAGACEGLGRFCAGTRDGNGIAGRRL